MCIGETWYLGSRGSGASAAEPGSLREEPGDPCLSPGALPPPDCEPPNCRSPGGGEGRGEGKEERRERRSKRGEGRKEGEGEERNCTGIKYAINIKFHRLMKYMTVCVVPHISIISLLPPTRLASVFISPVGWHSCNCRS